MEHIRDTEGGEAATEREHWLDSGGIVHLVTHIRRTMVGTNGHVVCGAAEYPAPLVVTTNPVTCLQCVAVSNEG